MNNTTINTSSTGTHFTTQTVQYSETETTRTGKITVNKNSTCVVEEVDSGSDFDFNNDANNTDTLAGAVFIPVTFNNNCTRPANTEEVLQIQMTAITKLADVCTQISMYGQSGNDNDTNDISTPPPSTNVTTTTFTSDSDYTSLTTNLGMLSLALILYMLTQEQTEQAAESANIASIFMNMQTSTQNEWTGNLLQEYHDACSQIKSGLNQEFAGAISGLGTTFMGAGMELYGSLNISSNSMTAFHEQAIKTSLNEDVILKNPLGEEIDASKVENAISNLSGQAQNSGNPQDSSNGNSANGGNIGNQNGQTNNNNSQQQNQNVDIKQAAQEARNAIKKDYVDHRANLTENKNTLRRDLLTEKKVESSVKEWKTSVNDTHASFAHGGNNNTQQPHIVEQDGIFTDTMLQNYSNGQNYNPALTIYAEQGAGGHQQYILEDSTNGTFTEAAFDEATQKYTFTPTDNASVQNKTAIALPDDIMTAASHEDFGLMTQALGEAPDMGEIKQGLGKTVGDAYIEHAKADEVHKQINETNTTVKKLTSAHSPEASLITHYDDNRRQKWQAFVGVGQSLIQVGRGIDNITKATGGVMQAEGNQIQNYANQLSTLISQFEQVIQAMIQAAAGTTSAIENGLQSSMQVLSSASQNIAAH